MNILTESTVLIDRGGGAVAIEEESKGGTDLKKRFTK